MWKCIGCVLCTGVCCVVWLCNGVWCEERSSEVCVLCEWDVWRVYLTGAGCECVHHHNMYVQEELSAAVDESTGQFEMELTRWVYVHYWLCSLCVCTYVQYWVRECWCGRVVCLLFIHAFVCLLTDRKLRWRHFQTMWTNETREFCAPLVCCCYHQYLFLIVKIMV